MTDKKYYNGLGQELIGYVPPIPEPCAYCDDMQARGMTFYPAHKASDNCKSGKHNHCTCDTCF